jgi:FeS assembly SUF system regulator
VLRITKLTDYAFVVLCHMANRPERALTSTGASRLTGLPQPSVSKILKSLARAQVLVSERGAQGGYRLAQAASELSVADIIDAVEGPIALTECSSHESPTCEYAGTCALETNWERINNTIRQALATVPLSDLAAPNQERLIPLKRKPA